MTSSNTYGCLAEFESVPALLAAVNGLRERGYSRLDAYTPYPVEGLAQALGAARDWTAVAMLAVGALAGIITLAIEYYAAAISYPINIGGRPDASWPTFIPAAVEMTILFAALAGVVSMLAASDLPRLHHPLFNSERFSKASRNGLLLLVRADDPQYESGALRRVLTELQASHVETVSA